MILRALLRFGIVPDDAIKLFARLPWSELSVWSVAEADLNSVDCFEEFSSYRSPPAIIGLIERGVIPKYRYAVASPARMFVAARLEGWFKALPPLDQALRDEGFPSSTDDFLQRYVVPKVWMPVVKAMRDPGRSGEEVLMSPDWISIYPAQVGTVAGYVLFHEGVQAYYPCVAKCDASLAALLQKVFCAERLVSVEPAVETIDIHYAHGQLKEPAVLLSATEPVTFDGQMYYRSQSFVDYSELAAGSWLSLWDWSVVPAAEPAYVPPALINRTFLANHQRLAAAMPRLTADAASAVRALRTPNRRQSVAGAFQATLAGGKYTLPGTREDGELFEPSERQLWTETGREVLASHDFLYPHIDAETAGWLFRDYNDMVRRDQVHDASGYVAFDPYFVGYCISAALLPRQPGGAWVASRYRALIGMQWLRLVCEQSVNVDQVAVAMRSADRFFRLFDWQDRRVQSIYAYLTFRQSADRHYLTHGAEAKYSSASLADIIGGSNAKLSVQTDRLLGLVQSG